MSFASEITSQLFEQYSWLKSNTSFKRFIHHQVCVPMLSKSNGFDTDFTMDNMKIEDLLK